MQTIHLDLDNDLIATLREVGQPIERTVLELVVLELYRRRLISGGKSAELLGIPRFDFIRYASQLGIPFFDMTEEEWAEEMRAIEEITREHPLSATRAR